MKEKRFSSGLIFGELVGFEFDRVGW